MRVGRGGGRWGRRAWLVRVGCGLVVALCASVVPAVVGAGVVGATPGDVDPALAPLVCSGGSQSGPAAVGERTHVRVVAPAGAVVRLEVRGFGEYAAPNYSAQLHLGFAGADGVVLHETNRLLTPEAVGYVALEESGFFERTVSGDVLVFSELVANPLVALDFYVAVSVKVDGVEFTDCDDFDGEGELLGVAESAGLAADPVNTATGNFLEHRVDLVAPAGVYGLEWARTYNSLDIAAADELPAGRRGVLGEGWVTPLDASLTPRGGSLLFRGPDGRRLLFPAVSGGGWSVPARLFASVAQTQADGYQLSFKGGEVWGFDGSGRLVSMADGTGNTVTIARSTSSGFPESITSATPAGDGYVVSFTDSSVPADGRVDRVTGPDGAVVDYTYNPSTGLLESVTAAHYSGEVAGTESFVYRTGTRRLVGIDTAVKPGSPVLRRMALTYDDHLRVEALSAPGGNVATFDYQPPDQDGRRVTTVSHHAPGVADQVTRYVYDPEGRLVAFENPLHPADDVAWSWVGSGAGRTDRLDSLTDAQGAVTDPAFDSDGRVESVGVPNPTSGAAGTPVTVEYCGAGDRRVTVTVDSAGLRTEYRYGTVQDPCPAGQFVPTTITAAAGTGAATETTVTAVPEHGLVTSMTDEDAVTTTYTWDFGRRLLLAVTVDDDTSVAGAQSTEFGYDRAGRLRVQRSARGDETWWTYDGAGRVLVEHSPVRVATKTWSCNPAAVDAPCSLGSPPSMVGVSYSYWLDGTLKSRTDESGNTWTYERSYEELPSTLNTPFDVAEPSDGWVEVELAPDDGDGTARDVDVSTYDAAGNLIAERVGDSADATGDALAETTWVYDAMGRVTRERSPQGVLTFYRYDRNNRLVATVAGVTAADSADPDESNTRRAVYDYRGRVTETFGPAGDVDHTGASAREHTRYAYDNADRVTEVIEGDGATARSQWMRYDAAGRLRFEIADVDRDHVAPTGTDPAGWDDDDRVVEHRYTDAGRPLEVLRPPVDVTSFNWGQEPTAEVQTVTVTATGGTWKLRVGADATAELDHGATAAQVEDALDALAGIDDGEVTVTAGTGSANTKVHVLTWAADTGDVAPPTAIATDLTGTPPEVTPVVVPAATVATATNGSAPRVTRYAYDDAGRQTSADVPLSPAATTTYWPDGQTRRQTAPGGNFSEYDYDPAGRVIATTTPSPTGTGTVTATSTYTPRGELATNTDPYPTGGTAPPPAEYTYWPDGNMRSAADPRAHPTAVPRNTFAVVSYAYDGRDNRTRMTSNALETATDTAHTELARRVTYNLDDQSLTEQRAAHVSSDTYARETHTYDDVTGRRSTTTWPSGRQVTYSYWNSGRISSASYTRSGSSTEAVEEFYDSFGQRTRMTGPGGNADYTWDGDANLVGFTSPGLQGVTYARTWDLDHNSTGITYNPGHATREHEFQTSHDQFGRALRTDVYVPQISGWWPLAEYTYDSDGNPRRQVVNSVAGTRTWAYPANGSADPVDYVQDRATGTGDLTQTLGWRPDGRLGSATYNPGTIGSGGPPASSEFVGSFGYDPAGQLTSRAVNGEGYASSTTYAYDAMGHRLSELSSTTAGGSTTSTAVYSDWSSIADQLSYTGTSPSVHTRQYSWGSDQSLTQVRDVSAGTPGVKIESISYDARGLPSQYRAGSADALAATRTYDGDGRLSRVEIEGGATYDLSWDPTLDVSEVLEVFTGTNTWTRLAYGTERVGFEYLNNNASVAYGIYGYDHQGSTITTANTAAPAGYGPYGAAIAPPAGDMFFGYRGELHIDGRIHLRNRDYDPTLGIFTTPDPVEGQPGTPTANAAYPYANNDPTNNTDPLGLFVGPQVAVAAPMAAPAVVSGLVACFSNPVCAAAAAFVIVGTALLVSSASTSPPRAIVLPRLDIRTRNTASTTTQPPLPPTNPGAGDQCDTSAPQTERDLYKAPRSGDYDAQLASGWIPDETFAVRPPDFGPDEPVGDSVFFTLNEARALSIASGPLYDGRLIAVSVPGDFLDNCDGPNDFDDYQDVEVPFSLLPILNTFPRRPA